MVFFYHLLDFREDTARFGPTRELALRGQSPDSPEIWQLYVKLDSELFIFVSFIWFRP